MVNPVYFWYPNLVGYARIVATFIAFSCVFTDPHTAAFFYLVGQGLDAVDGVTARYFNQCSKFGAVLDMLTDRMSEILFDNIVFLGFVTAHRIAADLWNY